MKQRLALFLCLSLLASGATAQTPSEPRLEIQARLFNAVDGSFSPNIVGTSQHYHDIDVGTYMAEQMLVSVRITPGDYSIMAQVHLTAVEDGIDKGEEPRVLIDRVVDVPARGSAEQVVFVGLGAARVRCLPVTLKARFIDNNPQVTAKTEARVSLSCNIHRP